MASDFLDYRPIGGINQEDPEFAIGETEVRGADNFLFERYSTLTRPGVASYATAILSPKMVRSFDFGSSIKTVASAGNKIYYLNPTTLAETEITGAGLTLANGENLSMDVVNGVVLVGGNSAGLARWDPAGGTYTVVASSNYRYVAGQISRAIAAYKIGVDALLDPRTVAWSKAGDETNWTAFGSGSTVLADATDEITGIGNIRGTVVVARTGGFHLGHATGNSSPAFTWELHSKAATGCKYPSTWFVYGTQAFFVGEEDVHTFNLVNVEDIGRPIRRELLSYLRLGYLYRGFVSQSIGLNARDHYHMVPMSGPAGLPHFSFDIEERKWARHLYGDYLPVTGWYQRFAGNASAPAFMDASGAIRVWDESLPCEVEAQLRSRKFLVGKPSTDYQSQRGMMIYKAIEDVESVTLNTRVNVGVEEKEYSSDHALLGGNYWRRKWLNHRLSGNFFTYDLTVPAGSSLAINYLGLEYGEQGQVQGA